MLRTKQAVMVVFALAAVTILPSCAPPTFIRTLDPGWNAVEVREDLAYEQAWEAVVDTLSRQFDIEILSREDGYLRTGWLHSWTGSLKASYKVRAVVKFTPDRSRVEIKSEAQHFSGGVFGMGQGWIMGTDERLTTTLRTDIMGKVGRVAR